MFRPQIASQGQIIHRFRLDESCGAGALFFGSAPRLRGDTTRSFRHVFTTIRRGLWEDSGHEGMDRNFLVKEAVVGFV